MYELDLPVLAVDESIVGIAVLNSDKVLIATNKRVIVVSKDARGSFPGSEKQITATVSAST